MMQNYPLEEKKHKLTTFKLVKWTIVVLGAEVGIQIATLILARPKAGRGFCLMNATGIGELMLYVPFMWKVREDKCSYDCHTRKS